MLRTAVASCHQVCGKIRPRGTIFRPLLIHNFCFTKSLDPRRALSIYTDFSLKKNISNVSNTIRRCNASSSNLNGIQKVAQSVLEDIRQQRIQPVLVPQVVQNALLQLVTDEDNVGNKHDDGPIAYEMLRTVCDRNLPKSHLIPRICSLSMQVIRRSGHPLASKEMTHIMWMILEHRNDFFIDDVLLNTKSINDAFCQLMRMYVEDDDFTHSNNNYQIRFMRTQVDHIVNLIRKLWDDPSIPLLANPEAIHAIILYWCRQRKVSQAHGLLKWLSNESQTSSYPIPLSPLPSSFTAVISAYGKLGEAESAEKVVHFMLSAHRKGITKIPPPNLACMNALIDGWARSNRDDAGVKAEETMNLMKNLHNGEGLQTKPNMITYSTCINAWAHSKVARNSAVRAEYLLRRLIKQYEAGSDVLPTESAFTATMNAWAKSGADDAPTKVESLLQIMMTFSKTNGLIVTTKEIPYSILIKAWKTIAEKLPPGDKKKRWCGDQILSVVEDMNAAGITLTPPTHNACITALLAVSPSDALLYFLDTEERFRAGQTNVDTRTFNSALNVIAAQNKPDGAQQAMMILERMAGSGDEGQSVSRDGYTYNITLKILSRSPSEDAALKASQLLMEMDKTPNVRPSYISFVSCMMAWARSDDQSKFDKIQDLLATFKTSYEDGKLAGRLSVVPYNTALAACYHNTSPKLKSPALRTALRTMAELRELSVERIKPDHTTYLSFFRAIESLRTNEDQIDDMIQSEFDACVHAGLCSTDIVELVYKASFDTYRRYFGDSRKPEMIKLPNEWSNKIKAKRREPHHASGYQA